MESAMFENLEKKRGCTMYFLTSCVYYVHYGHLDETYRIFALVVV